MVKRVLLSLAIVWAVTGHAHAQEPTVYLPTHSERQVADVVSTSAVVTSIALDAYASWQADNRVRAFALQGVRLGAASLAVTLTKHLVDRARPCASLNDCGADDPHASFFSGHATFAATALGGPRLAIALPLSVGTGGLRIAAGKHYLTDVVTGMIVGLGISRIR